MKVNGSKWRLCWILQASIEFENYHHNESYNSPMQNYFLPWIYILPLLVAKAMERDPIKLIARSLLRAT